MNRKKQPSLRWVVPIHSQPPCLPGGCSRAGGLLMLLLAVCTLAVAARADAMMALPPAATPDEAIDLAVRSLGGSYAGVCDGAQSPEDLGKICSRFVASCGVARAYLLGKTFSEYTTWLFIAQGPDGWRFERTAPLALEDSLSAVPWPRELAPAQCP